MVILIRQLFILLFFFSPWFFLDVYCQCENGKGTEGKTECISSAFFEKTKYEPAVCLTRSTIKALTQHDRLVCRNPNADYCWHQCSGTPTKGAQGKEVCSCDPEKEITPRDTWVPVKCYIPSGADCSWYRECLETRIPCEATQHKYALTYAEKYCKLYEDRYSGFSENGKKWIKAVRKCLQESLVHVLYPQTNVTCQNLKKTAFLSHIGCYRNPEPDVTFCELSLQDKARVFWTIKGALLTELLKTVSAGWSVLKSCLIKSYPQRTERIIQFEIEATSTKLTEEDVEDIGQSLSKAVGWPRDIVYYASSTTASDNLNIALIKIVFFSQSNNHVYLTEAERVVIEGTMNDNLVLLTLAGGKTIRVLSAKGCNDPDCLSTWFAVRTSNELRKGLCACVSNVKTAVNGRKQASINAEVGGKLRKGSCYKILDGPTKSQRYTWYQVTHRCWNENLWVTDSFLKVSTLSECEDKVCSTRSKELACEIQNNKNITLRNNHPSGTVDSAYASKNIDDTCNEKAACRSMYTCNVCSYPGAPGGDVCLEENLLHFINELGKEKEIFVSSIAGACHSCNSSHYKGLAVDLSRKPADFSYYIEKCRNMSGKPINEGSHIHCQF